MGQTRAQRAARARRRPRRARRPGRPRAARPRRDSRRQPCGGQSTLAPASHPGRWDTPPHALLLCARSDDFAVERDGAAGPLSDLWPGGYQPGDRLGVVLDQPMDPCGCSNLICATNTLFYDVLRDTKGAGNFFRYADTYLFGVGCEPGDFNQLDVWPLHKFVAVLQPTAEARARDDQRPPHHAARRSPRPARAAAARSCSRPGTRSRAGPLRRHVLAAHGPRARRRHRRSSATGSSRATSSRRSSRRPASAPASRRACAACAAPSTASRCAARDVPHAAERRRPRARCSASARCCRPATRRSPAAPRRRSSCRSRCRCRRSTRTSAPLDAATRCRRRRRSRRRPRRTPALRAAHRDAPAHGLRRDPAPHGRHVRGVGGLGLDLRLRRSHRRAPRRARDGRHLGRVAAAEVALHGPDALAAADYCFTSDMAGLAVGQVRYGAFCDERGKMLGDGTVYNTGDNERGMLVVTALTTDGDHFRRVTAEGPRRRDRRAHRRACRTCSCRARARASC